MVKIFAIFSSGTIIFVQACLIRFLFYYYYSVEPQFKSNVWFTLDHFQYIFIYYYFCQFQVISVTIVAFCSFNGRVPTILSTSVYYSYNTKNSGWLSSSFGQLWWTCHHLSFGTFFFCPFASHFLYIFDPNLGIHKHTLYSVSQKYIS